MTDKRILGLGVISLGWMGRLHARSYRAIAERFLAKAAAQAGAARLLEAVARHNATEDRPFQLSLSLGFTAFDPAAPQTLEALLEDADQQMYIHKRGKRLTSA